MRTQSDRVLAYLREHEGPTAMELSFGIEPYVANVRARISDLRKEGHVIRAMKRADGRVGFYLVRPAQATLGLVTDAA